MKFFAWYFLIALAPMSVGLAWIVLSDTVDIDISINLQLSNLWWILMSLITGVISYRLYRYIEKDL